MQKPYACDDGQELRPGRGVAYGGVVAVGLEVVLDGDVGDEGACGELCELFSCGVSDGGGRAGVEEEEETVQAGRDEEST